MCSVRTAGHVCSSMSVLSRMRLLNLSIRLSPLSWYKLAPLHWICWVYTSWLQVNACPLIPDFPWLGSSSLGCSCLPSFHLHSLVVLWRGCCGQRVRRLESWVPKHCLWRSEGTKVSLALIFVYGLDPAHERKNLSYMPLTQRRPGKNACHKLLMLDPHQTDTELCDFPSVWFLYPSEILN